MKSAGKRCSNSLRVLERVVPLRGRHRTRVEPRVEDRLDPAGSPAARPGRRSSPSSTSGRCRSRPARSRPASSASSATDPTQWSWPSCAAPEGQRRPPEPVAGQRPVDVVLQPVAEAAVLDVLGMPADGLVLAQQVGPAVRRAREPRRLRPVDERRVAAPAVRVGVLVVDARARAAPRRQVVDDRRVGVLHELARVRRRPSRRSAPRRRPGSARQPLGARRPRGRSRRTPGRGARSPEPSSTVTKSAATTRAAASGDGTSSSKGRS